MPDPDPMQLTLSQRFELERMYRTIDAESRHSVGYAPGAVTV
jgi:hypothetical protein